METFRFAIRFRLWHPTITPDEISAELGIQPRHSFVKTRGAYWCSDGEEGKGDEFLPAIDRFLDLLEPHAEFLRSFKSTGGTAELSVGWFTVQRSGGAILLSDRLAEMGALGVDLSLDVYAPDSDLDNLGTC
jgi:hypothetical protein